MSSWSTSRLRRRVIEVEIIERFMIAIIKILNVIKIKLAW